MAWRMAVWVALALLLAAPDVHSAVKSKKSKKPTKVATKKAAPGANAAPRVIAADPDKVVRDKESSAPAPAEVPSAVEQTAFPAPTYSKVMNLTAGVSFVFPVATLSVHVSGPLVASVAGSYYSLGTSNGGITGWGYGLDLNYYQQPDFGGLWLRAGLTSNELVGASNGARETFKTAAAHLTLGWRWTSAPGWNFGFNLGGNYFFKTRETVDTGFAYLHPAIGMDLGFAF